MTLSVLTIARKCLDIRGPFAIRQDVLMHQRPASLRSELKSIHLTRCKPEAPTELRVELTTAGRIDLRWVDNADNERGFYIRFRGKRTGFDDHTDTSQTNTDIDYASLSGLHSGFTYTIRVVAYNQAGESPPSNEVQATTPNVAETLPVSLSHKISDGPVHYVGKYPGFGVVPAGRLLRIRLPQIGFPDVALAFVKRSHSTQECNDPSAVVVIGEGQTTTPAQLMEIYGVVEPRFTTLMPIPFLACYRTTNPASPLPGFITIEIEVIFDMT